VHIIVSLIVAANENVCGRKSVSILAQSPLLYGRRNRGTT